MYIFVKNLNDMRNLFELGKVKSVVLYAENNCDVTITMLKNECFEIRQFNPDFNYWEAVFETTSQANWELAFNLAKSLIK